MEAMKMRANYLMLVGRAALSPGRRRRPGRDPQRQREDRPERRGGHSDAPAATRPSPSSSTPPGRRDAVQAPCPRAPTRPSCRSSTRSPYLTPGRDRRPCRPPLRRGHRRRQPRVRRSTTRARSTSPTSRSASTRCSPADGGPTGAGVTVAILDSGVATTPTCGRQPHRRLEGLRQQARRRRTTTPATAPSSPA